MSKVTSVGIRRPSAIVAGSLSDSDSSQSTGMRAKAMSTNMPTLQNGVLAGAALHQPVFSLPGIVVPKPRTNRNAISRTMRKISTETAEPSPRLTLEINWS